MEADPDEMVEAFGVATGTTWVHEIACAIGARAANGDVSAAKELREVTEGRVPSVSNLEGKIDYTAGQSAKEQLLKKLAGGVG
jgi:hypothetical protein